MQKTFQLIGFCLITISVLGQDLDFNQKSIQQLFEIEKSVGGVFVDSIPSFGILKNPHIDICTLGKTKVYIFKRSKDEFQPQLHLWYHFDLKDNANKGIRYHWGLYNPNFYPSKERERLEKLAGQEKEFRNKYNSLKKELGKRFGKPFKSEIISDDVNSFIENVFWEDNEKIIGLSIKFSRKLKEVPGIGVLGDFKIEVMATFK